jgi:signal transduction histidine kinase
MKQNLIRLSQQYKTALGRHLKQGPHGSLHPALALGRRAVVLGLETLELARIHEQAIATLSPAGGGDGRIKRSDNFFAEAITPIMETHRAARQSRFDLNRVSEMLVRRTAELAASNRHLQSGILRRKDVEAALKRCGKHYARLLKDSLRLQQGLRLLTHQMLTMQEDERKHISLKLQDEIAQTLLGINVRLLSLKKEARLNTKGFKKKIASTRRLVVKSARSVQRAVHEFGGL